VDRILIAYVRYVMELPGDSCADALYRHVPEKNDITVEQFMELRSSEGHDDYSKFFRGNPWWTKQKWGNGRCMGRPKNDIFWSNTPVSPLSVYLKSFCGPVLSHRAGSLV
jgi:hypothetical protein